MVSVDVQRFVDAPGGPGGGHGEREAIGAGQDRGYVNGKFGMAGLDEDFEWDTSFGEKLDGALQDWLVLGMSFGRGFWASGNVVAAVRTPAWIIADEIGFQFFAGFVVAIQFGADFI